MKTHRLPCTLGLTATLVLLSFSAALGQERPVAQRTFALPSVGLEVAGQVMILGIDRRLLPLRRNHSLPPPIGPCTYLSKPTVRLKPVLTPRRGDPKAPDNMAAFFYGTVLHEEGRFRMWYYACNFAAETAQLGALGPGDVRQGPVCYAESDDGIHWRRPNLGQLKGNLIPCYHVTGARGWGGLRSTMSNCTCSRSTNESLHNDFPNIP